MRKFFISFFVGLLLGISTWIITYLGIYQLITYLYIIPFNINPYGTYVDPTSFLSNYPLLLSILITGYFVFFKKNYLLALGIICGFCLIIGILGFIVGLAGGI